MPVRNSLFRLSMENLFVSGGAPTRESLLVIFVVEVRSIRYNITFVREKYLLVVHCYLFFCIVTERKRREQAQGKLRSRKFRLMQKIGQRIHSDKNENIVEDMSVMDYSER